MHNIKNYNNNNKTSYPASDGLDVISGIWLSLKYEYVVAVVGYNLKSVTGFGLPYKYICVCMSVLFRMHPSVVNPTDRQSNSRQDINVVVEDVIRFGIWLPECYVVLLRFRLRDADDDDLVAVVVVVADVGAPRQTLNGSARIP